MSTYQTQRSQDGSKPVWFYCLDHGTIEGEDGCRADVRLGPYPTREEAEQALETVEKRNEQWDTDPAWNEEQDG